MKKIGLSLVKLRGKDQSYQYIGLGIAPIKMFNLFQKTLASGSRLVL